jgi:hypothetical protein
MKIKVLLLWVLVFTSAALFAQDCTMYFPQEVGSLREMTNYDKKDRVTGKIVQKITDKDVSGDDVSLSVETIIYDEDDNEFNRSEANIGCIDGTFKISMEDYLGEMLEAYESMDIQMQGDNLVIPAKLKKGDELPDGVMNIQVQSSGITIVNMDVSVRNRKVLDREEITTDAGTFDCYKISYDTESKTRMITVNTSGIEWLAPGIGVVKTESYNKKGKLTGYSVLTSLDK